MTTLSVILCVRNGAAVIGDQLAALARQRIEIPWELVVVDNASNDGTAELVRGFAPRFGSFRVVPALERASLAYARNVGASAAEGEVLAFCDADDVADPGWAAALATGARASELVGGRLEIASLNDETARFWRMMSDEDLASPNALDYLPYAVGANFAVRRDTFAAIGGCDEAFTICCDDIDLSWRIQRAGGRLSFRSDAIMHYRLREDLRGMMRQRFRYGQAEGLLRRKFPDALSPLAWRDLRGATRHLLTRSWHLAADRKRRGLWLGVASYTAGRIAGR